MVTSINGVNATPIISQPSLSNAANSSDAFAQLLSQATAQNPTQASTPSSKATNWLTDAQSASANKPNMKNFMQATGVDAKTASQYLYGVVGANTDYRDWSSIMASSDPLAAVKSATHALYFGDQAPDQASQLAGAGYQKLSEYANVVAQSGNIAVTQSPSGALSLSLVRDNGYALGNQVSLGDAQRVLETLDTYGIDKSALNGLADQLDAKGIKYKPYELYAGTGSDHGIDLKDLASGGMGTAYDWTKDKNAALKDEAVIDTGVAGQATRAIAEAKALAERLGVVKNSAVTTEQGLRIDQLAARQVGEQSYNYVVTNGQSASWYASEADAVKAQAQLGGQLMGLTGATPATPATPANAGVSPATPATPATPVSPPVATESNPVSNDSSSAASVASQAIPTTPESAVTALQEQINQLTSGISSGTNTPMSSFMNSYNQLQALMAKMTDLQKSLAAA